MRIMIFTEGTILMHNKGAGVSRKERIQQVKDKDYSVKDYNSYIPVEKAVDKINQWVGDGAEIIYLTSRQTKDEIDMIKNVLNKYEFPEGTLEYRKEGEQYNGVAERITPNMLVEDDCESIGGIKEMTYTFVSKEVKDKIKSIPVKEFGGIDFLPDSINALQRI